MGKSTSTGWWNWTGLPILATIVLASACSSGGSLAAPTTTSPPLETAAPTTTSSPVTVADTLRDAGCIFAADTGYWDCQGPDFKGVDLSGADLEGADLAGAILFSVNFTGATLKDADLTGARGLGADFSDADLTGAALGAGEWTSASFVGADLAGADLSSAHLDQVDFTNANLTGAELSGRFLPGVIFVGTDLRNVDLSGAHLSGADFTNANLTGADLSGAHLGETDYTAGEFFTDNWPGPGYLGPATFVNADLTNATVCPIQNLHVAFPLGSSELVADGTTCLLDTLPLPGLVVFASPWFDGSDDEPEPLWQAGESECEWRSADLADGHWSRRYGCMTEFKIYVMSPDGSGLRRLTSVDYVDHYSPVWSPDGTRIAFISWHPEGSSEIHVMNADGTGVEQLTNGGGSVSWSPDGTRIAFIRVVEGASQIHVMNADGTGIEQLTDGDSSYRQRRLAASTSWSPDGTRIAFIRVVEGVSQIHVINADGTGIEQLTDDNGSFSNPAWSPDGTQIAAAWDREGHDLALVRMNADGSGLGLLKPTGSVGDDWQESPGSLAWSPDGGLIIHEIGADKTEIVISGLSGAWASTGVYGRSPDWID
jgi:uncharacterized protein YjbI with pentapeptide repeats